MILPNKYVTVSESFIGLSAIILDILKDKNLTMDKIWFEMKRKYILKEKLKSPPTYQKFILTLNVMYMTGMINFSKDGEIFNENLKVNY